MARTQDGVRVVIYDQEYRMRGELDPEYIRKLAAFLDGRMRSIAVRTGTVDSLRVAVLAALNIADEYHQLKSRFDWTTKRLDEKVDEYTQVLDQVLKQAV